MACDKQNVLFYFRKKTKYKVLLLLQMCVISFFLLERLEDRQTLAHTRALLFPCVQMNFYLVHAIFFCLKKTPRDFSWASSS